MKLAYSHWKWYCQILNKLILQFFIQGVPWMVNNPCVPNSRSNWKFFEALVFQHNLLFLWKNLPPPTLLLSLFSISMVWTIPFTHVVDNPSCRPPHSPRYKNLLLPLNIGDEPHNSAESHTLYERACAPRLSHEPLYVQRVVRNNLRFSP